MMNTNPSKKKRIPWTRKLLSNGPEYQFLDPLSGREVRFPNQLHRDNFCVQFGEPDIEEIIPEYPTVSVLVEGQLTKTRFDATVRKHGGLCILQEVKPRAILNARVIEDSIVRQLAAQKIFAEQTGAIYELRTETEIYLYPIFVENKRRMRQILMLHRGDALELEMEYLVSKTRKEGLININDLSLKVGGIGMPLQRMEAAAYRLYSQGHLKLNLKEARYGAYDSVASPVYSTS
jgi:hypothetical protein